MCVCVGQVMSIKHPATIIVCGGTGSGKTVLTKRLIENHRTVFQGLPLNPRITWCFGAVPPPRMSQRVTAHEGMIDEQQLIGDRPDILVIDDLMSETASGNLVSNIFTKYSHHLAITVIYITQNLYQKGQVGLKRNAHYVIMTRNPSDKSQLTTLGRQLFPRRKSSLEHFYESYDDATREKYGYLLIDVSPSSLESQKLKTNIFPGKDGRTRVIVYQLKK